MALANRRVSKELEAWSRNPVVGLSIESHESSSMLRWIVLVEGAPGTLYEGEVYRLQVTFSSSYPMDSPEVVFKTPSPAHPHIYTNGHICLSILYDEWSPAMTVQSVCLSILSMMSSAEEKGRPEGDREYCRTVGSKSPKLTSWGFHDESC